MKTEIRAEVEYWGAGFLVNLLKFPCYEEDGVYIPAVPFGFLHKAIALEVLKKPHLLTGNEIAFLRAQGGMTRSEAARKLGVTRRTLINWEEKNDRPIKATPLAHLGARCLFLAWVFAGFKSGLWEEKKLEPHLSNVPVTVNFDALETLRRIMKKTGQAAQIPKTRQGRHPRTGAGITIAALKAPRAKAEKSLKERANQ